MRISHRRPRGKVRWMLASLAVLSLIVPVAALADAAGHHGGFDRSGFGGGHGVLAQLTANPDCTLQVPANPLSAAGLATPYVNSCSETNQDTAAFVQAVIFDPATGISVFDPVVGDAANPATAPATPALPANAVVTIWTGFNGNVLKLTGPGASSFVNFAQQSYANSGNFFRAASEAIRNGQLTVPPLGTASDGLACPTVRDFSVVDQDQSDNVVVDYGAPFSVSNGSDDNLLLSIDAALNCTPWQAPLIDPEVTQTPGTTMTTAGPLEELQAAGFQQFPQALVPGLDPFVTLNGNPNRFLQALYRRQVDQPPAHGRPDTRLYCQYLNAIGAVRLRLDAGSETASAPVFTDPAKTLEQVLQGRFETTYMLLNCKALTGQDAAY